MWYWLISDCLHGQWQDDSKGLRPRLMHSQWRHERGTRVAWRANDPHVLILSPSRPSSPHCSFAITTAKETLTSAPCPPIRLSIRCCRLSVLWLQNGGFRRRASLWALSRQQQQRGGHFLLQRVHRHDAMARVQQGPGIVIKYRSGNARFSVAHLKRQHPGFNLAFIFNTMGRMTLCMQFRVTNERIIGNSSIFALATIYNV